MRVELASNGWSTPAVIKVIGGARPSIIGKDMMPQLGLQIVQRNPGQEVLSIQETVGEKGEGQLEKWQNYFSKLFCNIFKRVGKIRNYRVQAELFNNLIPIQQKGRRVLITLQDKVDGEIDKLVKQGYIERLEDCSDKYFVLPIVKTVKKDGSVKLVLEARELNKQAHKNKYQMPNIEGQTDAVGQTPSEKKSGEFFYYNESSMHTANCH